MVFRDVEYLLDILTHVIVRQYMFRLDAASGQQNKDAVLPHFIVKFLRIDSPIGILVEKFLSLNFLHALVSANVLPMLKKER